MSTEENRLCELIENDKKLQTIYDLQSKIGEGCFGTIYKAINLNTKRIVALKIELNNKNQNNAKNSNLVNQITILDRLKDITGVPKVYNAGKWQYGYYLELQLLSSSLHEERTKEFSLAQIKIIGLQLLQILKKIHAKGVVHQDLKPQNIMRNSSGNLFIIDYGLSAIYTNVQKNNKKRGFVGTPRYANLAAHKGAVQYPKDDIESLLYVLGTLYMKKAPWFQLKAPVTERLQMIQKYKQISNKSWFKKCGKPFSATYDHLEQLTGKDNLNYTMILNQFHSHRETVVIRTSPNQGTHNTRRRSQNIHYSSDVPIIQIHYAERSPRKSTFNYEQKIELSRSNGSYSQAAQGQCIEFVQLLTQKILKLEDNKQNIQDDNNQNEINTLQCAEPHISNFHKYHQLQFKNPFSATST